MPKRTELPYQVKGMDVQHAGHDKLYHVLNCDKLHEMGVAARYTCTPLLSGLLTPVKAVPAMNQAKGSRYHGQTEMRYKLADIDTMDVSTAPQAFKGFSSNTYVERNSFSQGLSMD